MNLSFTMFHEDVPDGFSVRRSVAIDTETTGLNMNRDRLCLVQMCTESGEVFFVKFSKRNCTSPNLAKLLLDDGVQKIFHFARFDVARLKKSLQIDFMPNVYCTKIASKVARTFTESHGLKTLVSDLLGIDLRKDQQTSYWGLNDLTKEQMRYAANDVIHLHSLKNKLQEMLAREGREEVAAQAMRAIDTITNLELAGWAPDNLFSH